ncbi:MAG: hypothetical protein KDD82_12760 [Planctomycetes bacterium]|nr:hypothetical protein [Planctomycetota bacterium]
MSPSPLPSSKHVSGLLTRMAAPEPLLATELRPPPSDLDTAGSMDSWIDMHHTLRRLVAQDTVVFLTDNAVGKREEENLGHLTANLQPEDRERVVPFLTCKHPLDYCLMYAARAASAGFKGLCVLGGDRHVGPPRCVEHAYELRQRIRERVPQLVLGGWANPHQDPARQVGYLLEAEATADFYLTQVVSHHDLPKVEAFLEEAERQGLTLPGLFGVFYYRSARARTLRTLAEFLPVPIEPLTEEFSAGAKAEDVCERTLAGLRGLGVSRVYLSNLGHQSMVGRMRSLRRTFSD